LPTVSSDKLIIHCCLHHISDTIWRTAVGWYAAFIIKLSVKTHFASFRFQTNNFVANL